MKQKFFWLIRGKEEDFSRIEIQLGQALVTRSPSPDYVRDLKRQLVSSKPQEVLMPGPRAGWLWTAVGVASGALLLVVGIKAVLALLGALGLMRQVQRHLDSESSAPAQQAVL
jgi:hypothetical protein